MSILENRLHTKITDYEYKQLKSTIGNIVDSINENTAQHTLAVISQELNKIRSGGDS